jgi:hypothetical protein
VGVPLKVEINAQFAQRNNIVPIAGNGTMITPLMIDETYWLFRVKLYRDQAIVGFPKYETVAIGFAQEEVWNTNFPYIYDTLKIYEHIKVNKKYDVITDVQCLEAIRRIQQTIAALLK